MAESAAEIQATRLTTSDTPLDRMYREARYARLYDSPDEVRRMVVARRLLRNPANVPWA